MVIVPLVCPAHDSVDATVGYPYTTNDTPLPLSEPPADSVLNTWNDPVADPGAASENEYENPLSVDTRLESPMPPLLNVGVAKSTTRAEVAPPAFCTVILQSIRSLTRTVVVPLVCPAHERAEAVVGKPSTRKETPDPTRAVPVARVAKTWNEDVAVAGAVRVNTKLDPTFEVESDDSPLPPVLYEGVEKSDASPVVRPCAFLTVMVQSICSPVLTCVEALE